MAVRTCQPARHSRDKAGQPVPAQAYHDVIVTSSIYTPVFAFSILIIMMIHTSQVVCGLLIDSSWCTGLRQRSVPSRDPYRLAPFLFHPGLHALPAPTLIGLIARGVWSRYLHAPISLRMRMLRYNEGHHNEGLAVVLGKKQPSTRVAFAATMSCSEPHPNSFSPPRQ